MVEMVKKEKKTKFKMPHSLVIIGLIVLVATILTWIVPSGQFARVVNSAGKEVIDAESFKLIANTPVSIFKIGGYVVNGYIETASLIFVILFSGAAFNVIVSSGALQSLISMVSKKFSSKETIFIPIVTLIFALICTTQGVNTFIGFAPVMVMFARVLGFDSIVGAGIILLGGAVGFSTGTLNVNTTIVAQNIAGLPPYSGIGFRAFCFVVFYIVTNIYLIRYAKKVRLNPELSHMYDLDLVNESSKSEAEEFNKPMDIRKCLVILTLFAFLGLIVYGGVKLDWDLEETAAVFIWMGIVSGVFAGFGPSKIAKHMVDGAKKMVGAALIIGLARSVSGILTAGNIMDTCIYGMAKVLGFLPAYVQGVAMYISNLILNLFITSGSGLANTVMPLFVPIADLVGLTRQSAVLAFNFGDGFGNYVLPTSSALMGILGAANIPYDRWMKFMWKLFLIWVVVGSILMVIAQIINYGPM
ncbi:MAG: Na+/H+ antiporter NhaC family protein [Clostridium sp.]|nr:Na+/H+ antiporter NhaC family protein [Clostridium sp.]MDU7085093.1 Na+/H+ antiporter NhaC family protein [Clostridium sp.]